MAYNDTNHRTALTGWRASPWLIVAELSLVAILYVADVYRLIPVSKTPFLFALGWISLRLRGLRWTSVGLARPQSWKRAAIVGLLAGIGLLLLELFVSYPLLTYLTGTPPDLSDFRPIVGNFKLFLITMAAIWIIAVLGEELVYRGYLMNRIAGLGGGTQANWAVSLVMVSVLFGAGHIDQGITGMTENIINGLLLGLLYLACGRNLVPPIIAHGLTNTADLILIYMGQYPGL